MVYFVFPFVELAEGMAHLFEPSPKLTDIICAIPIDGLVHLFDGVDKLLVF